MTPHSTQRVASRGMSPTIRLHITTGRLISWSELINILAGILYALEQCRQAGSLDLHLLAQTDHDSAPMCRQAFSWRIVL